MVRNEQGEGLNGSSDDDGDDGNDDDRKLPAVDLPNLQGWRANQRADGDGNGDDHHAGGVGTIVPPENNQEGADGEAAAQETEHDSSSIALVVENSFIDDTESLERLLLDGCIDGSQQCDLLEELAQEEEDGASIKGQQAKEIATSERTEGSGGGGAGNTTSTPRHHETSPSTPEDVMNALSRNPEQGARILQDIRERLGGDSIDDDATTWIAIVRLIVEKMPQFRRFEDFRADFSKRLEALCREQLVVVEGRRHCPLLLPLGPKAYQDIFQWEDILVRFRSQRKQEKVTKKRKKSYVCTGRPVTKDFGTQPEEVPLQCQLRHLKAKTIKVSHETPQEAEDEIVEIEAAAGGVEERKEEMEDDRGAEEGDAFILEGDNVGVEKSKEEQHPASKDKKEK
jgi:hypothetical protein